MLGLTQPVFQGSYLGFVNLASNASTDWFSITPQDFKNSKTGNPMPSELSFADVTVINLSSNTVYLRLRVGLAWDGVENEIPLTASSIFTANLSGLVGGSVQALQIKKADVDDEVQILSSFNPIKIV